MSAPFGIRSRVPADEYFALPGVSITRLKELRRSPQHYLWLLDHPRRETRPLRLGTAAHTAVLEPERFAREFAVWSRRTEGGKMAPRRGEAWKAFTDLHRGQVFLTEEEYSLATAIAHAVRANHIAERYLSSGDPEVTVQWGIGGVQCKGRVDWLTTCETKPCIVGLKTARDCRRFCFGSAAARLGYHLQWSWYFHGYQAVTGRDPKMVEIVVESAPPHAVAVYVIPDDILFQGRGEYVDLLKRLDECEVAGRFPGPQEEEEPLTLPSWACPSEDDISELGLI